MRSFAEDQQDVTMPVPTKAQVQAVLQDSEPRLRGVIDRAWQEWLDSGLAGRFIFGRVQSNIMFDFIARHGIAEFDNDSEVHVIPKDCTVKFLFRDQVLVRFKKANAKGVGSNIETQATLDFVDPQRTFPDFLKDIYKVEVCYIPDALGAEISEVAIVARDRKTRIWAYPIEASAADNVVVMPARVIEEATPPVVAPRKKPSEEDEAGA